MRPRSARCCSPSGEVEPPAAAARAVHAAHDHDPERLAEELGRVRRRGFAEARDEREEGLAAIAAPVRDSRGELVGILGVQGPSSRFDATGACGPRCRCSLEHAAALSAELGLRA